MSSLADNISSRMSVADPFRIPIGEGRPAAAYQSVHKLHKQAVQAYQRGDFRTAFSFEHETLQELLEVFREDKSGDMVPVLLAVSRNTRDLGHKSGQLLVAEPTIKKCFVGCLKNNLKKWGSVEMANQLMWIYFRTTNFKLCSTLLPQVDRATSKMGKMTMDDVPMSHRVTCHYYRGRLALFSLDPQVAESSLDFAFQHCAVSSPHNKRLILHSLVPAKLLHGIYPTSALLEKYNCQQYIQLVNAVKHGHIGEFEETVKKNQVFFIKKGLFMLIPWIRMLLHRNLFYQIFQANTDAEKPHHLDLNKCEIIMTSLSNGTKTYDKNIVHCILAGLIDHKFIKGYLSYSKNVMVLKTAKSGAPALNPFQPVKPNMFKRPSQ